MIINPQLERERYFASLKESDLFGFILTKVPDLQKTNEFDYTDVFSVEKEFRAELKCRRTHYGELLIEKIKWDALIRLPEKRIRYINSTPKGIYSFDIKSIPEPTWTEELMPRTTDFENNEKIIKVVGYLPLSWAKDITNFLL